MTVDIKPGKAKGTVKAPPSKSMAHRMLICAGLSNGKSVIKGISGSADMKATLNCLEAIGASYVQDGEEITVTGTDIKSAKPSRMLNCNESGSTLRFFIPLCLISGNRAELSGSETLMTRPLGVYKAICDEKKYEFIKVGNSLAVSGPLKSGEYRVAGNISSQFISGLLFALPLIKGDSKIVIAPPIESRSYIELTIEALSYFGVKVYWQDDRTIFIKGSQKYKPCDIEVEGDYSNAAFLSALNEVGSEVKVTGLKKDSIQGDRIYSKYFDMLNIGTPTINIADCPDLGPILFAVAAAKNGGVFTGTKRLKIKESDRGAAMAEELKKFGVAVTIHDDDIVVYPADFHAPNEVLFGHNDHRIVMALAVLTTLTGGRIKGVQAAEKSFPDFFERLKSLGVEVEENDD